MPRSWRYKSAGETAVDVESFRDVDGTVEVASKHGDSRNEASEMTIPATRWWQPSWRRQRLLWPGDAAAAVGQWLPSGTTAADAVVERCSGDVDLDAGVAAGTPASLEWSDPHRKWLRQLRPLAADSRRRKQLRLQRQAPAGASDSIDLQ